MSEMTVMSDNEMQKRITGYLATHKQEIDEMIDKKIENAVKRAVSEAFSTYHGYANDKVKSVIQGKIDEWSEDITISKDDLVDQLNKKVVREVKRAAVKITFDN